MRAEPQRRNPQPRDRRTDAPALKIYAEAAVVAAILAVPVVPLAVSLIGASFGLPLAAGVCSIPFLKAWKQARARARHWQLLRGQCPHCGYDLRRSPRRCPECGRPVTRE